MASKRREASAGGVPSRSNSPADSLNLAGRLQGDYNDAARTAAPGGKAVCPCAFRLPDAQLP
jgi:hypothetical protein